VACGWQPLDDDGVSFDVADMSAALDRTLKIVL
jgi:hypothetical protein